MIAYKLPADRDAAIAVFLKLAGPGKVLILQTLHDDGCRAIVTQRDRDCSPTCHPDHYILELEPSDTIEPMPGGGSFVAFGERGGLQ